MEDRSFIRDGKIRQPFNVYVSPSKYLFGYLLEEGDTVQEGDYYLDSGVWRKAACTGLVIGKSSSTWVRTY